MDPRRSPRMTTSTPSFPRTRESMATEARLGSLHFAEDDGAFVTPWMTAATPSFPRTRESMPAAEALPGSIRRPAAALDHCRGRAVRERIRAHRTQSCWHNEVNMDFLPLFHNLRGRLVLVVGGG